MDLHLKQRRSQHESEQQQPSVKISKLLLDHHHQHASSEPSALPLFVSDSNRKISGDLSAPLPDFNTRMGSYFSLAQWQELELQALIYRYMLAGAAVPTELLQPIKKSLLYSSTYFLHHPYSHYQPALLASGYWGRAAMDPEPGRCRRTDGKKWRCSRDVVTGQNYCERHVHRGRNRSRKPVEMPTSSSTANNNDTARFNGGASGAGAIGCGEVKASSPVTTPPFKAVEDGPSKFGFSGPSPPIDLLQFSHSSSDSKNEHKGLFEAQSEADNRSDGHFLRHFFDDWPRTLQDPDNSGTNASPMYSTSLPGNSSSDVSLKLSTGNGDQLGALAGGRDHQLQPPLNWTMDGWAAVSNRVASMGGPLGGFTILDI
ncbi:Growth-regulating factor 3 [Hibiscus syriacus]|uniref:Growth-regulating factor n=1 Tax=Hibiscus syriacus TaxID=106335 RepID=A0A6A2XAB4_HIBSY|nr:growth-regulating factor 3-like [Hibiscus syriacus]KAE8666290.1 Growth-regulating factor 3 [Hibiscus syriacus]